MKQMKLNEHKLTSPIGVMINNYIHNQHGEVVPMRSIYFSAWNHPQMGGDYGYYGIPITDQWMEDLGFEWSNACWSKTIDIGLSVEYSDISDNWYFMIGSNYEVTIKYIHELQNLYFALTGCELMIRERI